MNYARFSTCSLARLRPLMALGTTLGLLLQAVESHAWGCALYPSLVLLMLLVLVAELHRLLESLPLARHDHDEQALGSPALGITQGPCHTEPLGGDTRAAMTAEVPPGLDSCEQQVLDARPMRIVGMPVGSEHSEAWQRPSRRRF